jgi:hypothetical protein
VTRIPTTIVSAIATATPTVTAVAFPRWTLTDDSLRRTLVHTLLNAPLLADRFRISRTAVMALGYGFDAPPYDRVSLGNHVGGVLGLNDQALLAASSKLDTEGGAVLHSRADAALLTATGRPGPALLETSRYERVPTSCAAQRC